MNGFFSGRLSEILLEVSGIPNVSECGRPEFSAEFSTQSSSAPIDFPVTALNFRGRKENGKETGLDATTDRME